MGKYEKNPLDWLPKCSYFGDFYMDWILITYLVDPLWWNQCSTVYINVIDNSTQNKYYIRKVKQHHGKVGFTTCSSLVWFLSKPSNADSLFRLLLLVCWAPIELLRTRPLGPFSRPLAIPCRLLLTSDFPWIKWV